MSDEPRPTVSVTIMMPIVGQTSITVEVYADEIEGLTDDDASEIFFEAMELKSYRKEAKEEASWTFEPQLATGNVSHVELSSIDWVVHR